ncbi:MAG: hypothetical protein IK066_04220 [Kiritimatiellae bacterium]|nr:hypothetical protein [Kiritimatiellia bacterium]
MSDPEQARKDTDAYLARIRKTIADSERLVEAAKLRMAETDRMLARQGLTREQVMGFRFSGAQREAVNRELVRMGLEPLGDEMTTEPPPEPPSAPGDELAERQKKFGMMMKPFQI